MSDLEYMFEKMLKEKFPVVNETNRLQYLMVELVANLRTAFIAGYNSN